MRDQPVMHEAVLGADTVNAGDGDDRLFGGATGTTIDGGPGFDTIDGSSHTSYTLTDTQLVVDAVSTSTITNIEHGSLQPAADGTADASAFTGSVLLQSLGGTSVLKGGSEDDTINGNDGRDTLVGNGGQDEIVGWNGKDTLKGGDGKDTFHSCETKKN